MSCVYAVWTRSHSLHHEDPSVVIGVYTERSVALQVGRESLIHGEDEYWIREHFLNQFGPGEVIWCSHADKNADAYARFYKRFWPAGYPIVKSLDEAKKIAEQHKEY